VSSVPQNCRKAGPKIYCGAFTSLR